MFYRWFCMVQIVSHGPKIYQIPLKCSKTISCASLRGRDFVKTRISTLREITSLPPLFGKIKSKTLKLFGHVKRSTTGLSKLCFEVCFEGMIQGERSRARPKHRWRDNIPSWSGIQTWDSINQNALDRTKWKSLSHVNSQSAHSGNSDT